MYGGSWCWEIFIRKINMKYKAYIVEENEGCYNGSIKELNSPALDEGKVLIKVLNSSLNYKDALAATGAKGVVRSYPFVPGIDVAGKVLESSSSNPKVIIGLIFGNFLVQPFI